jgi:hypothetical protein
MIQVLSLVLPVVSKILERAIPDPEERAKVQAELAVAIQEKETAILNAARDVIVAEGSSESKLARNWRPVLMYLLMGLLVWLIAIAPSFGLVEPTKVAMSAVPEDLWNLLMIGMGGYIAGRTGEKIAASLAAKK